MLQRIQEVLGFSLVAKAPRTLHANICRPRDIACMKISAIASRGTNRDFIGLYLTARQFGLTELFGLFQRKFVQADYSKTHILKSLVFFDDAEKDPMPHMLVPLDWDTVKIFFRHEVPGLL